MYVPARVITGMANYDQSTIGRLRDAAMTTRDYIVQRYPIRWQNWVDSVSEDLFQPAPFRRRW